MKRTGKAAGIAGRGRNVDAAGGRARRTSRRGAGAAGAARTASPSGRAAAATYHYAEATPQRLRTKRTGAVATFTVHHPRQVRRGSHSLVELAVAPNSVTRTYVEAGWIVTPGRKTRLFVFWWRNGTPHCYNFGCGFVDRGKGLRPGSVLKPGSKIRLAWKHRDAKWFLIVNGRQSGFYPDRLWRGTFTGTKWFQVFGEVADGGGRLCEDMGNGRLPTQPPEREGHRRRVPRRPRGQAVHRPHGPPQPLPAEDHVVELVPLRRPGELLTIRRSRVGRLPGPPRRGSAPPGRR